MSNPAVLVQTEIDRTLKAARKVVSLGGVSMRVELPNGAVVTVMHDINSPKAVAPEKDLVL